MSQDNNTIELKKYKLKDLFDKLYKKGILIRKCDNFNGIDNTYYRIAVKYHSDNKKLINTISEVINNG